jgi:hypothetical protein
VVKRGNDRGSRDTIEYGRKPKSLPSSRVAALEPLKHALDIEPFKRDLVDLLEQRVALRSAPGDEELVDLVGGDGALELLAAKELLLELLERLARLDKGLGAFSVSATDCEERGGGGGKKREREGQRRWDDGKGKNGMKGEGGAEMETYKRWW